MILPVAMSQDQSNTASTQCWQAFQVQPYLISTATEVGTADASTTQYPSVTARLNVMASYDSKNIFQQQNNEMIAEIVELGAKGRGGFFASLAGNLATGLVGMLGG